MKHAALLALALAAISGPSAAEPPEVVDAVARQGGDAAWRFDVTLSHPDTGWDHYADGWEVLDPDGERLGYRELLHPHVEEQPFTRSLGGVTIPAGVERVSIRAHDSAGEWSAPGSFTLDLER